MKNNKNTKGITLIALVITIIVMLILVAVTVNIVINGGIFDYAGKAVGETKNAIDEEEKLSNGGIQVDGVWYDSIDDYLNGIQSAVHSWTRNGDTFTCSHCGAEYEMGEIVAYTAAGTKTSTTITAAQSGLDGYYTRYSSYPTSNVDANGAQTVEVQSATWVVLGIEDTDEDGTNETLLITTSTPVGITSSADLYVYGAAAYNNIPDAIDTVCKELYSNSTYGTARNMKIEDVNNALNYDLEEQGLGGIYYDSGCKTTGDLTTKLRELSTWDKIKNNGTYTPDGTNTEEALGEYELNGYWYYLSDDTTLVNDVNDSTNTVTTIEKNLIFGTDTDYYYWLASRGVYADSAYVFFGPGTVDSGSVVLYGYRFDSSGDEGGNSACLRPVVSLQSTLPEGTGETPDFYLY